MDGKGKWRTGPLLAGCVIAAVGMAGRWDVRASVLMVLSGVFLIGLSRGLGGR